MFTVKPILRLFPVLLVTVYVLSGLSTGQVLAAPERVKPSLPAQAIPVLLERVSAGSYHTCGLKSDGTITCWGFNNYGQSTAPGGTFTQVSAGEDYTCGLKSDGTIACWGDNYDGESTPPTDTFIQVSAGKYHACGLKSDGTLACWGLNNYGESSPPAGTFTQVSAGAYHTCGLKSDGTLACWGDNGNGQTNTPNGTFSQVSAGDNDTCGLKSDGTLACWGYNGYGQTTTPTGTFSQVSAGGSHTCALKSDGTLACWGLNNYGESSPPTGTFTQVSAGAYHTCGLESDGTIVCWGDNEWGMSTPPGGVLFGRTQISAGDFHTCFLKSDGTLACWGAGTTNTGVLPDLGQSAPTSGTFTQVSAGGYFTCGLKSDGSIVCWGAGTTNTGVDPNYGQSIPPTGTFTQVSAGYTHACGLKNDGTIVCWGLNTSGQSTPPAGTFTQVSAGGNNTCGLKSDGTLACWGANNWGQSVTPAGTFTQVSAGYSHTCGVKSDGTLACWGYNNDGEATPPTGTFTQVSAGYIQACGVKSDGTLACWGSNNYGQSIPPAGTYTQVDAGGYHTCGLKSDGNPTCWGLNDVGQSNPFSISGNAGVAGATLSYTDGTLKTATAGSSGNYSLAVDYNWSGTITLSKSGYYFAPLTRSYMNVLTDQTDQNYTSITVTPMISAGGDHTCWLRSDGTIVCWGNNSSGQSTPPGGTFTQVSAGGAHTCGLESDGILACWGNNGSGQSTPPTGTFAQVSAGNNSTCGLKSDGTLACWGDNSWGKSIPPAGTFTQVSAGYEQSCGVKSDGTIACWGDNSSGEATPPAGTFTQVSANYYFTCGLKSDGTIICWGDNTFGQSTPPSGPFTQVSAGLIDTCGVKSDSTLECWGADWENLSSSPAGVFTDVSAGGEHNCGLRGDGTLTCWGYNDYGKSNPYSISGNAGIAGATLSYTDGFAKTATTDGSGNFSIAVSYNWSGTVTPTKTDYTFSPNNRLYTNVLANQSDQDYTSTFNPVAPTISTGAAHTCLIKNDSTLACWGAGETNTGGLQSGQSYSPPGTFAQVGTGYVHTCGLKSDGTLYCWGDNEVGQTGAPSGTFTQISAGWYHNCALTGDGTAVCWGWNAQGQATPPSGTFIQVTAGFYHTCGLKSDDTIICWGDNTFGQSTPPSGTFTQISAGRVNTCGVKSDGTLACWGDNSQGQSSPPAGTFTQVSAGEFHTCGVRAEGTLACWGDNSQGQSSPPAGTFTQVSAGGSHSCGIKTDGTIICWGANNFGQANPFTISGNAGVAGVTLNYNDGFAKTATADGSGNYSLAVDYNWSGTVTASKTGYTFSPVNQSYINVLADQTGQNYTSTAITQTLAFATGSNGSITAPATSPTTHNYGDIVTITAVPNPGYHFVNWTGDVSTVTNASTASTTITMNGDYSITANFAINSYTVTFKNHDSTVLKTQSVDYGSGATAPADPTRPADAQYTYTFNGWDVPFDNITGNLTVTAIYSGTVNSYTVTFKNYDSTVLKTQGVDYGSGATAPTDPTRPADAQYTYTFNGWDVLFDNITGNLTVTATYNETVNSYTVTFKNYDNTVLKTQSVDYGSGATAPIDPTTPADAQYTYTFIGWDVPFDSITGNLTVTATYSETVNSYTVTFKNFDGTVLKTQSVDYGSSATAPTDPTRPADAQYTYTFNGWDVPFDNITGNLTVTATYSAALNTYTITGNAGIAGATLTYTGGSTSAGTDGTYTIPVSYGWSGTITPSKTGYVFVPDHITYPSLSANQPGQNYTAFVPTLTDDNSYALTYQNWSGKSDAKASGGGYHYSSIAGQTAAYTTTVNATSITLLTYKGPDQGKVQILVDNVSKGTFDLYNKTALYKQSITITGLLSKKHTITVKVLGQKNLLSKGTQVRLDAFKVGTTTIEDNNIAVTYGSWIGTTSASAYGGKYRSSSTTAASITFTITGDQFHLVTALGASYGKVDVYKDGVFFHTYDLYNPTQQWQYKLLISGLGSGTHTITIKVEGAHNVSSTGNTIIFDAVMYP